MLIQIQRLNGDPMLTSTSGPLRLRFTGDLHAINGWTVAETFPMPVIDQELDKARNAKLFADFDLTYAYWQFLVNEDSQ